MATPAAVTTALRVAVVADTSVTAVVDNGLERLTTLAVGATLASVAVSAIGNTASDSNVTRTVLSAEVHVMHKLAEPRDEGEYTSDEMQTDQVVMLTPVWWRAITGVHTVLANPSLDVAEREGNVVNYTVVADFSIDA